MNAQDPEELFDLCDPQGNPLGVMKARARVHRDGDWHRSVHVWIVLPGEPEPWVVFQVRSMEKDTYPGRVDVAVAGHLRAGEGLDQALRECHEEIGLEIQPGDVTLLGTRRRVATPREGVLDREIQTIYVAFPAEKLDALVPGAGEVESLLAVPWASARGLCGGTATSVTALRWACGKGSTETVTVTREALVPSEDGYLDRVMGAIAAVMDGHAAEPFVLG